MKAEITLYLTQRLYGSYFPETADVSITYDASDLYGKRVTIAYEPETTEDEKLISEYGDIYKVPSYLVRIVPLIMVEGEVAATGKPVTPGEYFQLTMDIKQPGVSREVIKNPLTAGGNYAVTFDYGTISYSQIEKEKKILNELEKTATEDERYTDKVMGTILNCIGTLYFGQLDALNGYMATTLEVRQERLISETVVGFKPGVETLFGAPIGLTVGSYYMDVDTDIHGVVSLNEEEEAAPAYMIYSGIMGSDMEGKVFEQTLGLPSVSTISVLREANTRGIGIVTVSSENTEVLDKLDIDQTAEDEIKRAVSKGMIAIVPERNIDFYQWSGTGYMILDPETLAGAYMISGSICGGQVILTVVLGLSNIIIMMNEAVALLDAMLASTNPVAILFYMTMMGLSVAATWDTIGNMIAYCITEEPKHKTPIITDFAVNVALIFAGYALKNMAEYLDNLFKKATSYVDDVDNIKKPGTTGNINGNNPEIPTPNNPHEGVFKPNGENDELLEFWKKAKKTYGEDVTAEIARHGKTGKDMLNKHGEKLADAIKKVGKSDDVFRMLDNFPENGDEVLDLIIKYGDEAVDMLDAGKSVDDVAKALKGGNNSILTQSQIDEILSIPKGSRPDPSTYLSQEFISTHLSKFDDGASIIMTKEQYIKFVKGKSHIGIPDDGTQFVMPKNYCDEVAKQASGDIGVYETRLGFDVGHFSDGGGLVRIDIDNLDGLNLRMPSGNEYGANNHWIPGGYTDGGVPEAVTDLIPNVSGNVTITELK